MPCKQGPITLVFTGTYEHTIDAKQRLAIPAEIRSQIKREHEAGGGKGDPPLYVTLGEQGALCLYTESGFEKRAEALDDSPMDSDNLLTYERLFFSLSRRVELDTQGRVRLPEQLLGRTRLGSDVVLIGVKDHVEVRDREEWNQQVERILNEQPGLLMNPRRAMKKAD